MTPGGFVDIPVEDEPAASSGGTSEAKGSEDESAVKKVTGPASVHGRAHATGNPVPAHVHAHVHARTCSRHPRAHTHTPPSRALALAWQVAEHTGFKEAIAKSWLRKFGSVDAAVAKCLDNRPKVKKIFESFDKDGDGAGRVGGSVAWNASMECGAYRAATGHTSCRYEGARRKLPRLCCV